MKTLFNLKKILKLRIDGVKIKRASEQGKKETTWCVRRIRTKNK